MSVAEWIEGVGREAGIDLSRYAVAFEEHAITRDILYDISDGDWKEVIPEVGPRIILRQAANDIYLTAELANLKVCDTNASENQGTLYIISSGLQSFFQLTSNFHMSLRPV